MRLRAPSPAPQRLVRSALVAALGATVLLLSGCGSVKGGGGLSDGFLVKGVTQNADVVRRFWIESWIALLVVGVITWGLMFWAVIVYRRREGQPDLPVQTQYNVPLEVLYTVIPVLMIGVFFFFTARHESDLLDTSKKPDVTINVVGKQWSWDFNYVEADVHEAGTQAELTGRPGVEQTLPTLYLPVNKRTEFLLTARDVIHSFWVPSFLQKLDMIPGRVNRFQVVPTEEGTFQGKCAELCGAYHSQMLFNVKVVSQAEYDQHVADLKAQGLTGQLGNDLNRSKVIPQDQHLLPNGGKN